MTARTSQTFAQRTGQGLGRAWCWVRDQQYRLVGWATAKGVPNILAKLTMAVINLIVLAALLYAAFWVVLVVGLVVVLLAGALNGSPLRSSEEDDFSLVQDHKNEPGYDPYFYPEDEPDPRFEDK
ncbi:MAG: hypothetical protein BACD_02593 [Bacteroides rodentium]